MNIIKTLICLTSIVTVGILNSCNNSPSSVDTRNQSHNEKQNNPGNSAISGNYYSQLEQMGLATDNIIETDENFIIDDDIVIHKKNLSSQLAKTTQRRANILMTPSNASSIRLQIHPSMSDWTRIIQVAVSNWNISPLCRINITIVTSNPELTIFADTDPSLPCIYRNLPPTLCGMADFCCSNAGATIAINKDSPSLENNSQKYSAIMHKIGHTIGLAHTENSAYARIPGTPATDNKSLMRADFCGTTDSLSFYDRWGISTLYPTTACLLRYAANNDHFYTNNISELGMGNSSYRYEGITCQLFTLQETGTLRFFRFRHRTYRDHFYTVNYSEGINQGYIYEGIVGYVKNKDDSWNTVPLYRYFNNTLKDHFYTTNWNELKNGAKGYVFEGIACYVKPGPGPSTN